MKVLFFDTESTDLTGNWGRILCASYLCLGDENVVTHRKDIAPWRGRSVIDDAKLVKAAKKEIESADIIVGWNSIRHDIPLLNARLAAAGEDPIRASEKYGVRHLDLMYYAGGNSMKIGSRSLANVSQFFGTEDSKTKLDGEIWQLAAAGDSDAMDEIVVHCELDVKVLAELFPKLAPYVQKFNFPLAEIHEFLHLVPSRKA